MGERGKFVVVDGIDGVGKGVFLKTFVEEAQKQGKKVFDALEYWKAQGHHPLPQEIIGRFHVVVTAEPTFVGIGKLIREEFTANTQNEKPYTPEAIAEAYALDRRILYEQLLLPLLKAGIDIYQSRSFSTSLVYQRQSAHDQGRDFSEENILSIPGNAFCLNYPMNFLIIPTIAQVEEALRRTQDREKKDNCIFENLDFQLKIKTHYESSDFRAFFEKKGVRVVYVDAGKTLAFSREQAQKFYSQFLY